MKKSSLLTTFVAMCYLLSLSALGQDPGKTYSNSQDAEAKVNSKTKVKKPKKSKNAPFDVGLTVLIAAGIGAGVKKAYDMRKRHAKTARAAN